MKKTFLFIFFLFKLYASGANADLKIEILHINDTHSHLEPTLCKIYINHKKTYVYAGGYAKIANYIKEKKTKKNVLVLHAGDAVQGTLYYTLFKGRADIEALNLMHIDAMSVGNHEWDSGADSFAENFAQKADFPILGCDIDVKNNSLLKNIIKPYVIKTVKGQKIAIVGDSIDSGTISNPGPTVKFLNYLTSARKYVKELEKKGINKIIFLTHIGYKNDIYLAKHVKGIDIIVGGHSHTLLGSFKNIGLKSKGPYPTVINNGNSKTLIVTAWKWGLVIGDLYVTFDKKGNIINYSGTPVMLIANNFLRKNRYGKKTPLNNKLKKQLEKEILTMNNIKIEKNSADIEKIIHKYKPEVAKLLKQTVAYAEENIINVRIPGQKDPKTQKPLKNGSELVPLVALAMYKKALHTAKCDFSIQNAGAVRTSIHKGKISIGEIYMILPFNNTLVTLKMKGKNIKKMLENVIKISFVKKIHTGAFPYLGNAEMSFKITHSNVKITELKFKKHGKWINVQNNKYYTIAANSYIANGGDYYSEMSKAKDKTNTGFYNAEIFINFAKKSHILTPLSNKIKIIKNR